MKNKILKLCKRMNKVTVSEIAPIIIMSEEEISSILNELVLEDKLTVREDLIYFYKEEKVKPKLPLFFELRTKEEINLLLKCFCSEVSTSKVKWIMQFDENTICKFYSYFREIIYNKQLEELNILFNKNPLLPCERNFIGVLNYMYYFDGKTYVSNKKLLHKLQPAHFSKLDMLEFKKDYSKLLRKVKHNTIKNTVHLHLAEQIFRFTNDYDEVYEEIKGILNL